MTYTKPHSRRRAVPVRWTIVVAAIMSTLAIALMISSCGATGGAAEPTRLPDAPSSFEAGLLTDGHIDFAEYTQAYDAGVSCMREGGLNVDGPNLDSGGRFYDYSVSYDMALDAPVDQLTAVDTEVDRIMSECDREFLDHVEVQWTADSQPTSKEVESAKSDFEQCLRQASATGLVESPTIDELYAAGEQSDAAFACTTMFQSKTATGQP